MQGSHLKYNYQQNPFIVAGQVDVNSSGAGSDSGENDDDDEDTMILWEQIHLKWMMTVIVVTV